MTPSQELRLKNRRAAQRQKSSNPALRDAWEREGVLVCGQCSHALQNKRAHGVTAATYPQEYLDAVFCPRATCAAVYAAEIG